MYSAAVYLDAFTDISYIGFNYYFLIIAGHTEVAKLLLTSGANPLLAMGHQTAVDIAADFDHKELVLFLRRHMSTLYGKLPENKIKS